MTVKEAQKAMNEMKAQGVTDDDLLGVLYLMFQDDKLTFDELEALVDSLGYQITEEFRNMSPEDQKTKGFKEEGTEDGAAEGVSKEDVEQAKEVETEEDSEKQPGAEESEGQDKTQDDDEEELKQARKLYGFDK